jgi:hypothetical protein
MPCDILYRKLYKKQPYKITKEITASYFVLLEVMENTRIAKK